MNNHNPAEQLQPRIHTNAVLRANPTLSENICSFINEGFRYVAPKNIPRWEPGGVGNRLPTPTTLHTELGDRGFIAVIYDPADGTTPIACTATAPWTGGFAGRTSYPGDTYEREWEIKLVTTQQHHMGKGLAGKCVDAIISELGRLERGAGQDGEARFKAWLQTVECVNGAFWKKKGWVEVCASEELPGRWGAKTRFRLLVLVREFGL